MPIHFANSSSRAGVRSLPSRDVPDPTGQRKLVPGTPPTPTVEAKSSFTISTWSPKYAIESPCRAFNVLAFKRTCQADSGSDATLMFMNGSVKKLYPVPHGQNSTSAPDFML